MARTVKPPLPTVAGKKSLSDCRMAATPYPAYTITEQLVGPVSDSATGRLAVIRPTQSQNTPVGPVSGSATGRLTVIQPTQSQNNPVGPVSGSATGRLAR